MEKQKMERIFDDVNARIKQNSWERDAVKFNTVLTDQINVGPQYSREKFEKECIFLRNQWEVSLDYSIKKTNLFGELLRKIIKVISKIFLRHYSLQQNSINFSNMQALQEVLLFIMQSQKDNLMLKQKCEMLEKRVKELETLKDNVMNEGKESD